MTTTWTKIGKAAGTSYTKVSGGYHMYDDVVDIYDATNVTYDGMNSGAVFTKISKASGTSWTKIPKAT